MRDVMETYQGKARVTRKSPKMSDGGSECKETQDGGWGKPTNFKNINLFSSSICDSILLAEAMQQSVWWEQVMDCRPDSDA